jgi:hypothetical protein
MVFGSVGLSSFLGMVITQNAEIYIPISYTNMLASRTIYQAKYKVLTKQEVAIGNQQYQVNPKIEQSDCRTNVYCTL